MRSSPRDRALASTRHARLRQRLRRASRAGGARRRLRRARISIRVRALLLICLVGAALGRVVPRQHGLRGRHEQHAGQRDDAREIQRRAPRYASLCAGGGSLHSTSGGSSTSCYLPRSRAPARCQRPCDDSCECERRASSDPLEPAHGSRCFLRRSAKADTSATCTMAHPAKNDNPFFERFDTACAACGPAAPVTPCDRGEGKTCVSDAPAEPSTLPRRSHPVLSI